MIKIKNISKSFSENKILDDVSFEVQHNDILSVIGKSGVGKSVLLKTIVGLQKPDQGNVIFDDVDIHKIKFNTLQRLRAKIGMIFQFGALFDSMNVSDNISLALKRLTDLNQQEIKDRIHESLVSVDLADSINLMPSELSGGMKKRVGIARAIALKPNYLFYDEPTSGLDPVSSDSINRLIKKIQSTQNVTSVVITHDMNIVKNISNRVIMIEKGKVCYDGLAKDIMNSENIIVKQFVEGNSLIC